jgi:hypothetical protein
MIKCHSCKNKTSTEQCTAKPLNGFIFCKRHLKVKKHRLWEEVNNVDGNIRLIQKIWRGYTVRNYLKVAGVGVLKRSLCHNDEELITGEEKEKQDPFDYFSFEENGKIWWFDVRSLYELSMKNIKLTNPYTKQDISIETRKRLREICILRKLRGMKLFQSEIEQSLEEKLTMYWTTICQQLSENHFDDVNPIHFISLSRNQLWVFTDMLRVDTQVWAAEHKSIHSRRNKFCWLMRQCLKYQLIYISNIPACSYQVCRALTRILRECKDPYPVCFMIASALYRL